MRQYDFVKLYIQEGFRGEGRNYGAKKATGDIIAFIDADCIANAFWIQELIEGMKKADVVTGDELSGLKKEIRELKKAISESADTTK